MMYCFIMQVIFVAQAEWLLHRLNWQGSLTVTECSGSSKWSVSLSEWSVFLSSIQKQSHQSDDLPWTITISTVDLKTPPSNCIYKSVSRIDGEARLLSFWTGGAIAPIDYRMTHFRNEIGNYKYVLSVLHVYLWSRQASAVGLCVQAIENIVISDVLILNVSNNKI